MASRSPRHPHRGAETASVSQGLWVSTNQASDALGISSKTLFRMRQSGLLKAGHHWVRKNPTAQSSDLLWQIQRCEIALGRL